MLVLIRMLVVVALAVVTVAPHPPHAAPAAAHDAVPIEHAHQHGTDRDDDSRYEGP